MAIVLEMKKGNKNNNKVRLKLCCNKEEFRQLFFSFHSIHLFQENNYLPANIVCRGAGKAQKFFTIPSAWVLHRRQKKTAKRSQVMEIQRLDCHEKAFFIYTIPTLPSSNAEVLRTL